MPTTDVIILGDGLIAKSFALALNKIGLRSQRVAKYFAPYENDPRSYAIAPSSMRLLRAIGLQLSPEQLVPVRQVELGFGENLRPPLFPINNAGQDMFTMIDHHAINAAMDAALDDTAVDMTPTKILQNTYDIELPELDLRAPLLVVAEGKQGENLARLGIAYERHDYHQIAITAKFETEMPHDGVARQLFEPTGPIGILPHGSSEISIVWSQKEQTAKALLALDEREFTAALEAKIGASYGALNQTAPCAHFPLFHAIPTRITGDRFALIGDSAHSIHPIAGQGLNLGLRDVACLLETLRQTRSIGLDIGAPESLTQYKNWRKADIARLSSLTRALNELTQSDNPLMASARALGVGLLNTSPFQAQLAASSDPALNPQPPLLEGRLY